MSGLMNLEGKALLFYKLAAVKDRKHRFKTYRSSFVGKEMVDSMVVSGLAGSREEAVQLGCEIAESFDLFENCDKNFVNKTTSFEDEPNRLYRFSSGALVLIGKMNEREMMEDENSVPTVVSDAVSLASNKKRPIRGPGLQRQNGMRMIESFVNKFEDKMCEDEVGNKKKNIIVSQKEITVLFPRSPMQAAIEEDNQSRSSSISGRVSTAHKMDFQAKGLKAFRKHTKELPKVESGTICRGYSKDKKAQLGETKPASPRLISRYQTPMESMISCTQSVTERIVDRLDIATCVNVGEKLTEDVTPIFKKTRATHRGDECSFFSNDTNASNLSSERHRYMERRCKTWGDDRHTSLIDEFDTDATGGFTAMRRESLPVLRTAQKPLINTLVSADYPSYGDGQLAPQTSPYPGAQESSQDESEEEVLHPFVTSPQDLPPGLRRRMSDKTETFDNFEFILNKKEGNLLDQCTDDDRSMWTEYIIGDDEGREKYRQKNARRIRNSSVSDINNETVYRNSSYHEKVTCAELNRLKKGTLATTTKGDCDNQSYMDFTVFDSTVALSYVDDEEELDDPEPPPALGPPEDEKCLFHIFADRSLTQANEDDGDDMTQITMDCALVHQSELNQHRSSSADGGGAEKSRLTSKHRIQTMLWNDLSSKDFSVVRLAMEELRRIVASEAENRKQIVRMGGVMAVMGTMEKSLKEETIQYHCCVIIELLASMEPDAMKAFNEMNGIQLIVRSMQDQADSDRIQEAGRAALATLCRMHQPGVLYSL